MLRDAEDARSVRQQLGIQRAFIEPSLISDAATYGAFLSHLARSGMLGFSIADGRRGALGVFFVSKKDGRLRLIFDTRILNCSFREPPRTALPSTAAFSAVECDRHSPIAYGVGRY